MATTIIDATPTKNKVFVDIYDNGEKTIKVGGKDFILMGDNNMKSVHNAVDGKHPGIRPRWAKVLATSDEAEKDGILVGNYVLCDTMKWTRKVPRPFEEGHFSMILSEDILLVSDTEPNKNDY